MAQQRRGTVLGDMLSAIVIAASAVYVVNLLVRLWGVTVNKFHLGQSVAYLAARERQPAVMLAAVKHMIRSVMISRRGTCFIASPCCPD